jgi:hypothetical protein
VLDAVYGNPERDRLCDATPAVTQQCDGRSACVIVAGNALCGDPDFGVPKRLFLAFKCGGSPARIVTIAETAMIRLGCDGPGAPPPNALAAPGQSAAFHPAAARLPAPAK